MKSRVLAIGVFSLGLATFSPAFGASQTFFTPAGSTDSVGDPVSASVTFVTGSDTLTVTLENLLTSIKDVGQAISDLFFALKSPYTATTGGIPAIATYANIDAAGIPTVVAFARNWDLSLSGGVYHLNGLGGGGQPAGLIVPDLADYAPPANGSIAGNGPHNPFAIGTATFTLAVAGLTSSVLVCDVVDCGSIVFSFGTTPGDNVPVPIPAAVWLFGSALLGLIGIARRKYSGATSATA